MKNRPQAIFTLIFIVLVSLHSLRPSSDLAYAGNPDTVRMMSYNILNYPGSDASVRNPYFRRVVHTAKPDVLVVQEIQSQSGVNTFLNSVLNYYQPGLYSTIAFHDGDDTDNHIFYKSSKVAFISANYIATALRDIAEYVVRINSSSDTVRLYSLHLKASTGYEAERLAEATILRNHLNNLPQGAQFLIMGDFNIYTSTEPAFQKLIGSEADNDGRARDPLNAVGNWNNTYSFRFIHTQSPRVRQFGGGSTGGMDDRFDMILPSYSSLDDNIITSSYTSYGNDGNHFNDSINRLPNGAVPDSVANGLHYAADHLPVFCDFKFSSPVAPFALISPLNGSPDQPVSGTLLWQSSSNALNYDVYLGTSNPPVVKVGSDLTDTSYAYGGLSNSAQYYWKVVAKSGTGSTDASGSPWSFTTITAPPAAFNLLLPGNGTVDRLVAGSLSWEVSANAAGYDVYLDTIDPPAVKVSSYQPGTIYSFSGLSYGREYYWKVTAKNAVDSVTATGAPWHFTTAGPPPEPFQLILPADDEVGRRPADTLVWSASPNAVNYDVYIDVNDPPIVKIDSNLVDTAYLYSGLSPGTVYNWKVVSKNISGTAAASNAPRSFTIASIPVAPSEASYSSVTESGLRIIWSDNASDETGYRIYRSTDAAGPFFKVNNDLPADSESFEDNGLEINRRYFYRIVPFNDVGEGDYASIDLATLAVVPDQPVISDVRVRSLSLAVIPGLNPAPTEFAVRAAEDTSLRFVQTDGTLGFAPVWQTYSGWGNDSGINLSGLTVCKQYHFSVKARNLDGTETALSIAADQELPCNFSSLSMSAGWNLISLPMVVDDQAKSSIFPNGSSSAFTYAGSYVQVDTMHNGTGYWLKFDNGEIVDILGDSTFTDTVDISEGWNLIGSVSVPVAVTGIVTVPEGIVISDYFSYDGTYTYTDTLYPGKGYWVKSVSAGKLIFSSP